MIKLSDEQVRAGKRAIFRSSHRFKMRLQRLASHKCGRKMMEQEAR